MNDLFRPFALAVSRVMGSPWAFLVALGTTIGWALTGSLFHYSDTWQLVINTSTTIVTFLMVFLIQNTQNRDAKALHLKLDELLRAVSEAHNRLVSLEDMSDAELDRLHGEFQRLKRAPAAAAPMWQQSGRLDPTAAKVLQPQLWSLGLGSFAVEKF